MADEKTMNGVASENDDRTADSFDDVNHRENETKLKQKIEALEKEKFSLVNENEGIKDQMLQLTAEIESLRSGESDLKLRLQAMGKEVEQSEERKRVLESIANRAVQLETEVSRLQHDLIASISVAEEVSAELYVSKRVLGEREAKLDVLNKDKMDTEKKIRELEKKIGVLEVKEVEERSKRVRIEEEMRDKLSEKEQEMFQYKSRFLELEKELAKKEGLEEKLKVSEKKVREMEEKMVELQKEVEEAQKVIGGVKERTIEAINGIQVEGLDEGSKGLKLQWPVLAVGSTGAIAAAAAVVYICYARRT